MLPLDRNIEKNVGKWPWGVVPAVACRAMLALFATYVAYYFFRELFAVHADFASVVWEPLIHFLVVSSSSLAHVFVIF